MGVKAQGVVGYGKTFVGRYSVLSLLDLGVVKLFHFAAVQAHQVIVVLACMVTLAAEHKMQWIPILLIAARGGAPVGDAGRRPCALISLIPCYRRLV